MIIYCYYLGQIYNMKTTLSWRVMDGEEFIYLFLFQNEKNCKIKVLLHYNATLDTLENTGNIPTSFSWCKTLNKEIFPGSFCIFNIKAFFGIQYFFLFLVNWIGFQVIMMIALHCKQKFNSIFFSEFSRSSYILTSYRNKY